MRCWLEAAAGDVCMAVVAAAAALLLLWSGRAEAVRLRECMSNMPAGMAAAATLLAALTSEASVNESVGLAQLLVLNQQCLLALQ